MGVSDAKRLEELETESAQLKRLRPLQLGDELVIEVGVLRFWGSWSKKVCDRGLSTTTASSNIIVPRRLRKTSVIRRHGIVPSRPLESIAGRPGGRSKAWRVTACRKANSRFSVRCAKGRPIRHPMVPNGSSYSIASSRTHSCGPCGIIRCTCFQYRNGPAICRERKTLLVVPVLEVPPHGEGLGAHPQRHPGAVTNSPFVPDHPHAFPGAASGVRRRRALRANRIRRRLMPEGAWSRQT